MNPSDEMLMAYVDGELAEAERAAIDAAMAEDAALATRVGAFRAQRELLARAFAPVLSEPVPQRLVDAARRSPASGAPVDLAAVRERREARRARPAWRELGALAASLLLGVLIGRGVLQPSEGEPLIARSGSALVARGALDVALSAQASGQEHAGVAPGFSYRTQGGAYCRTFATTGADPLAGIACRSHNDWVVEAVSSEGASSGGDYRMASTALPADLRQRIEADIEGDPLDAAAEATAIERRWR
jgi:hypothetical protein